jgi:hypothetical protein
MPLRPKPLPATERLRELFRYEPMTGAIFPRQLRTNRKPNQRCDAVNQTGYRVIFITPLKYYAHRIAWKLHYGTEPSYIDHINGDKGDNRIVNLREASHTQNLWNVPTYKSNTSGIKGVHKRGRKWAAQINAGRRIFLGKFDTKAEAAAALIAARKKLHGNFAKH